MRMLVPREHGAYGQLVVPLISAFAVAGITPPALLTATSIVAGFVAHEPLVVLVGAHGVRAAREQRAEALRWLAALGALAIGAGALAIWTAPRDVWWSFLLPLVPVLFLLRAIAARQEKTCLAETALSLAFALATVPVCLSAGAAMTTASSVAMPFALIFVVATLAVRAVILKRRGGGDERRAAASRRSAFVVAIAGIALLTVLALLDVVGWVTLVAAMPGLLVGVAVAFLLPAPRYLRMVGWSLVAGTVLTGVAVIAGV